jgi:hypothetical protein
MFFSTTRLPLLAVAGLLGLASCSKSADNTGPSNRIAFNDFESVDGWGAPNSSLTTAQAHSGHYAVKVDKDVEYSLGYNNLLGKASASKIKKLIVHGWVYVTGPKTTASLVLQVVAPDKNNQQVFWGGVDLSKEVHEANEWQEVRQEISLPDNVEASQQLRVYMWRGAAQQPVYLDDLEILKGE